MATSRTTITVAVGGTLEDDAAAFLDAVRRAEQGEIAEPQHLLSFESWEAYHRNGLAEIAALLAEAEAQEAQ